MLTAIRRASYFGSNLAAARPALRVFQFSAKASPMKYRGIRYTIRVGIERAQYRAVVYPAGVETLSNRISGSREDAEADAWRMINKWLGQKSANEK
jgi:hypothetical protein